MRTQQGRWAWIALDPGGMLGGAGWQAAGGARRERDRAAAARGTRRHARRSQARAREAVAAARQAARVG
eukprot:6122108-Prymnesium_polylepis.1